MSDLDIENRNLVSVFDKLKALVTKHSFALRPVTLVQRKRFQNKTKPVTQWQPGLIERHTFPPIRFLRALLPPADIYYSSLEFRPRCCTVHNQ